MLLTAWLVVMQEIGGVFGSGKPVSWEMTAGWDAVPEVRELEIEYSHTGYEEGKEVEV